MLRARIQAKSCFGRHGLALFADLFGLSLESVRPVVGIILPLGARSGRLFLRWNVWGNAPGSISLLSPLELRL